MPLRSNPAPASKAPGVPPSAPAKVYDRAYFDRWYRRVRVHTEDEVVRKAAFAVGLAEHVLARPVRNVLDVGCGEAVFGSALRAVRPEIAYVGLDPSEYVVATFGESHGVRRATFGALAAVELPGPFDLIVCSDVLHYVEKKEIETGLAALVKLLSGVALLEVLAIEDDPVGDRMGFHLRPASFYRRLFRGAGLVPLGLQAYALPEVATTLPALSLPR